LNSTDKNSLSEVNSTGKTILKSDYPELAAAVCEPKTIKIHFEISEDEWTRASRYITNFRMRHEYSKQAFIELINRKEGRDKKLQQEKIIKDSKYIQDMIDRGLIKLPVNQSNPGKIPTAGSMR